MSFSLIRHVHTSQVVGASVHLVNHADLDATTAITIDLKFFRYGALDFIYRRIDGVGNTAYGLEWNGGDLRFTVKTGAGTTTLDLGTTLVTDNPYHVVCSYDGAVMEILAEDRLTGTTYSNSVAHSGTISASTNDLIAPTGYMQFWDLRLWKDEGLGIDLSLWDDLRDYWPDDAADYTTDHSVSPPTRAYLLGQADPEPEAYGGPDATVVGDYYGIKNAWDPELLAAAQTIGLVVANAASPSGTAAAVKATLEAMGHTVTYVDDGSINGASDLTIYSLIFVAEVTGGGGSLKDEVAAAVRANPVPAIILLGSPGTSGAGIVDEVAVEAALVTAVDVGTSAPSYYGITELVGATAHPIVADIEATGVAEIVYHPIADTGGQPTLSLPTAGSPIAGTPLTYYPGTTRAMVIAVERGALDLDAVATISRIVVFASNLNGAHHITDRWWWNEAIRWATEIAELLISGITDTTGTLRLRNVPDAEAGEVQYQTTLDADTTYSTPFDDVVLTGADRMVRHVVGIAPETAVRSRARWRVDALSAWSGWLEVEWETIPPTEIPTLSHWVSPEFGAYILGIACPQFAVEKPQLPTSAEISDDSGQTWSALGAPVEISDDDDFTYYEVCFNTTDYTDGRYTIRFTQTDGVVITHYGFFILNSLVGGFAGGYAQFTGPWKKFWHPTYHRVNVLLTQTPTKPTCGIFCGNQSCGAACKKLPPGFPPTICDPLLGPSTLSRATGHIGLSIDSPYPGPSFTPLGSTGYANTLPGAAADPNYSWLWNHHGDITVSAKFLPFVTGGGALWDVFWAGEFVTVGFAVMAREGEPDSGIQVFVLTGIGLTAIWDLLGENLNEFRWHRVGVMGINAQNPGASSILCVKVGPHTFIQPINGGVGIYDRLASHSQIDPPACCVHRACSYQRPVPITLEAFRPDPIGFPNRWTIYAEAVGPFVPSSVGGEKGAQFVHTGGVRNSGTLAQILQTVDLDEPLGCGALTFFTHIPSSDIFGPASGSGRFLDHWSARVLDTETCEPTEIEPDPEDLILEVLVNCGTVTIAPPFGGAAPNWFNNADIEIRDANTLEVLYSADAVTSLEWLFTPGELPYDTELEVKIIARDDGSGPIEQDSGWIPFEIDSAFLTDPLCAAVTEKAWIFTLDGHIFYVLNFNDAPALIYDMTTGQWARWSRDADPYYWNMFRGIVWKGRVVAADISDDRVLELDPHSFLDEESIPIRRKVTGFQPLRGSASARLGSLRITARKEDAGALSTLGMRFSNDNGNTWSTQQTVQLAANSYSQRIEFRSLGRVRAPGRLWEIEDVGGFVRIEGADVDFEGAE